ncbi:amidohydrolase [Achromobacter marplatensis]|uniref:Hippurate hydrolase n=1 Tax=Achromobacter marplatensis TaxID=470868 RepID=A0ABX9GLZ0_9BURK|nr:M20 aminoacylase family protein [Achromobacter marplatensis]OWT72560.1 amidohydrolase [Achromobacter marplatensis]RBP24129.1 hippurate hydrolase [Achromobacter marplatensis]CAB3628229.1 Hippurate hydrolase [Achromobacter marplatensis]
MAEVAGTLEGIVGDAGVLEQVAAEASVWRRQFHAAPELRYEEHATSAFIAEKLRAFGFDRVETGIGKTGVVGVLAGRRAGPGRNVGLRADMDALPIHEANDVAHKSRHTGIMHACGHDGHSATLLAAARYLSVDRDFAGTAVFIFQPAEEGGAGGKAMIEDGLFERFDVDEVYGLHNMPNLALGKFSTTVGPVTSASDRFTIDIEGRGSHASRPQEGVDTVIVGTQIVNALQTIVSRNVHPHESAVVSITMFHAGETDNVIPQKAQLRGTVRTFNPDIQDMVEARMKDVVAGIAGTFGATAKLHYLRDYPVTLNHPENTAHAVRIARSLVGPDRVVDNMKPVMGGEDFSFMLQKKPGAFVFFGNGPSFGLHTPQYDFNDKAISHGAAFWIRLVQDRTVL